MSRKTLLSATCALFLAVSGMAAHAATFDGKLWIVSNTSLEANFPVPIAKPDATFVATHLSFFGSAPSPGRAYAAKNNTVSTFLNSAAKIASLAFSGLYNGNINGVVTPKTAVTNSNTSSCNTRGVFMEFTGTVNLVEDQAIYISHDDSVALKIDGTQVLTSGNGAFITGYQFTGKTGSHRVDLVFANGCGIGYLSFSPAM